MQKNSPATVPVTIDWGNKIRISKTTLTTHMWNAPPLMPGRPAHDGAFRSLKNLKAENARFLTFWTHPGLSVPELKPPTETETSWNFTHIDPFVNDFMDAAEGRPVVANLATVPTWMYETPKSVGFGDQPDSIVWDYEQGTVLKDKSITQVADYFDRFARWYIDGGFKDELGVRHDSDYRYKFAYWEVLCEPDVGHQWSPEDYTKLYDLVYQRLHKVDPAMRFIGLSLSPTTRNMDYFTHFLNPANHEPGVTIDAFSHHFYATVPIVNALGSEGNAPFSTWPATFFALAEGFLDKVALVEAIKKQFSPNTETHINEIGTFPADALAEKPEIPDEYWPLGGALVAYLWSRMVEMGIDLVGVAEFLGYPTVIPGTSLVNWDTGEPNARYRVLKLLIDNFGKGDEVVKTVAGSTFSPEPEVHGQGFVTKAGKRLVLLVNKAAHAIPVDLSAAGTPAKLTSVSVATGDGEPVIEKANGPSILLQPFATMVVELA